MLWEGVVNSISFDKIPVKPQLYKDYIAGNPKLFRFFSGHHRNSDDLRRIAKAVVKHNYQRKELVDILRNINQEFGLTPAIEANLEMLKHRDTVSVITGQQAGLFTGPLNTILKAISTLKTASYLAKLLNRPVVPLFWMESSDHDLKVVNHIYFPGNRGPIKYTYGRNENPQQQSVGSIQFKKDFTKFSERIKKTLPKNDFYDAVTRLMDENYRPGVTYSEAFGRMISRLLGRFGLIIVDAQNVRLKRLASPIIIRKLKDKGRMNRLLLEQSEELKREKYELQIQVKSELLNIFILKDNNRIPLNLLGEVMSNDNSKAITEDEELLQIAEKNPERFSPKVAFRPIVQDFLFPTVAYIGGPSELAYFAQLKKVYESFEIQMPVIWPRASASLLDAKVQRYIQKTGIKFEDIFRDYQSVLSEILTRNASKNPNIIFSEAEAKLDDLLKWLQDNLIPIDKGVASEMDTPAKKMHYQLNNLKNRTLNILKTKEYNLVKNWDSIRNQVYPNKKLQERVYNIIYYLSRYGFWLMDYFMETIDVTKDEHQILQIPS